MVDFWRAGIDSVVLPLTLTYSTLCPFTVDLSCPSSSDSELTSPQGILQSLPLHQLQCSPHISGHRTKQRLELVTGHRLAGLDEFLLGQGLHQQPSFQLQLRNSVAMSMTMKH